MRETFNRHEIPSNKIAGHLPQRRRGEIEPILSERGRNGHEWHSEVAIDR